MLTALQERDMGFNPLLSGSVFLTTDPKEHYNATIYLPSFNPLLSGSVFLTERLVEIVNGEPVFVSIPSLAGQFF